MILPRSLVAPLAMLVSLATGTLAFSLGIAAAPEAFVGGEDVILLGPSGEFFGRASIDARTADALAALPSVTAMSAEVYVPSAIDGRSLFVRGASVGPLFAIDGAALDRGRLPVLPTEALAGARLADLMGWDVGSRILVPGSLARTAAQVEIVGIFDGQTPLRDELVIDLDLARDLAGLPSDRVHLARALADDGVYVRRVLDSYEANFSYSRVELSSSRVFAGEPLRMSAHLTNWGQLEGVKRVEVRAAGSVVAAQDVRVPPRTTVPVSLQFALSSGDQAVTLNPTFNVTVRDPTLVFAERPSVAMRGEAFAFRILDAAGEPRAGVEVRAGDAVSVTDQDGRGSIVAEGPGPTIRFLAWRNGSLEGSLEVPLRDPPVTPGPNARVVGLTRLGGPIGTRDPIRIEVRALNDGGQEGSVAYSLRVDGEVVLDASVAVAAGATATQVHELSPLAAGDHKVAIAEMGLTIPVRVYAGADPAVEDYAERLALGVASPVVASSEATDELVRDLVGDISLVVTLLVAVSSALVALGIVLVISRAVAEARPRIGLLLAVGSSKRSILSRIEREAALLAAAATAIGGSAGITFAAWIASSGSVRAFGHSVDVALSIGPLALLVAGAVLVTTVSARWNAGNAMLQPIDVLLRGAAADAAHLELAPIDRIVEERP